ncbi:MAG: hypothetical protein P1U77_25240 [Rubripirellula sp.]|nr:hypothetical protein [Rubripirellula sp.]
MDHRTIQQDGITASLAGYQERSSSEPVIVVNPKLYFGKIADLLVAAGIQQQVHDGKHFLFGHEIILSSVMAGPSASTSGDCLLIAGHLDAGCVVGTRSPISVRESRDNAEMLNDRITFVPSWRGDVLVSDPDCLSKITLA